jgi:hypothetical protein
MFQKGIFFLLVSIQDSKEPRFPKSKARINLNMNMSVLKCCSLQIKCFSKGWLPNRLL